MSKVVLLMNGDQVLFSHTVPDAVKVIMVPLDTPVAPVPTTLVPEARESVVAETPADRFVDAPRSLPAPNSRNGYAWTPDEVELAKSNRTDEQVSRLTGRGNHAVRDYRRKIGVYTPGKSRSRWTAEEQADLLSLAGKSIVGPVNEYAQYIEYFPRHQSASALYTMHQRLLNGRK